MKREGYRMHSVSKQMGTEWVVTGMGFGYGTGIQQSTDTEQMMEWKLNRCETFHLLPEPTVNFRNNHSLQISFNSYLLVDKRLI